MGKGSISWLKQTSYLQAVVVGLGLGIGFMVPLLWWVAILAIAWMLYALHTTIRTRKLIILFTIVWGVKSLCSLIWVWNVFPIHWIGDISVGAQLALLVMYWLTAGLWLGSGGALVALLSRLVITRSFTSKYFVLGAFPFIWLLSELFAAGVFSVFTAGPGSSIQTYFSFGMIGYLLAITPVGLWSAGVLHVYGLSVVLSGLACVLYSVKNKLPRISYLGVLGIVLISYTPLPAGEESTPVHTVISIDTQFSAELFTSYEGYKMKEETLREAVASALARKPQLIALPEDSRYLQSNFNGTSREQVMTDWELLYGETDTVLIDSGRDMTDSGETVLRANVFDGASNRLWQFDKQYLVPQGEYVPYIYELVLRLLGYGAAVEAVEIDSSYRPGPLTQTTALPPYIPGVLFCFEGVNPQGVMTVANNRPVPFIVHPISHAWFHTPKIFWRQLDVMLQVQARYSGVPIVSSGNMASGKLYLPSGDITKGVVVETGEHYTLRQFTF
jgi:hypothetical protein